MNRFDSSTFFEDDFYIESATLTYKSNNEIIQINVIATPMIQNDAGGTYDSKRAYWCSFDVFEDELSNMPSALDILVYNGNTFTIDNIRKDGDVYVISAYTNRKITK